MTHIDKYFSLLCILEVEEITMILIIQMSTVFKKTNDRTLIILSYDLIWIFQMNIIMLYLKCMF